MLTGCLRTINFESYKQIWFVHLDVDCDKIERRIAGIGIADHIAGGRPRIGRQSRIGFDRVAEFLGIVAAGMDEKSRITRPGKGGQGATVQSIIRVPTQAEFGEIGYPVPVMIAGLKRVFADSRIFGPPPIPLQGFVVPG